jgi:two-component system KDP operon response regulator KdpE
MFFRRKKVIAAAPPIISGRETRTETAESGAPRKKILVVDDDPVVVKTLSLTLNARGYNIVSARDGAAAIGLMRDEKPDMLLLDVSLPPDVASGGAVTWNGFQVAEWLNRVNERKIPTIIISGADKPEYQRQAAAAGAEGFMAKPLNNAKLLELVKSALGKPEPVVEKSVGLRMAN